VIHVSLFILFLLGCLPFIWAWFALKATSLRHAALWAAAAWLSWGPVLTGITTEPVAGFIALAATACAGVAVLGARRPHVLAWNFVVLGLLAVMILPLLESWILGGRPFGPVRLFFLGATLAVGIGNYLPTCFGPAALLVGLGCGGELLALADPDQTAPTIDLVRRLGLLAAPWLALACSCSRWRRRSASALDRAWLDFRDRFGLFWGMRVKEQFNNVARHAGSAVSLSWSGRSGDGGADETVIVADFQAVVQRFV